MQIEMALLLLGGVIVVGEMAYRSSFRFYNALDKKLQDKPFETAHFSPALRADIAIFETLNKINNTEKKSAKNTDIWINACTKTLDVNHHFNAMLENIAALPDDIPDKADILSHIKKRQQQAEKSFNISQFLYIDLPKDILKQIKQHEKHQLKRQKIATKQHKFVNEKMKEIYGREYKR